MARDWHYRWRYLSIRKNHLEQKQIIRPFVIVLLAQSENLSTNQKSYSHQENKQVVEYGFFLHLLSGNINISDISIYSTNQRED